MWAGVRQGSGGEERGEVETGRPGMEKDGFPSGPQDSVKDGEEARGSSFRTRPPLTVPSWSWGNDHLPC